MPTPPESNSLEGLLTHTEWVRGIARRLVSDPTLADDLVQDSWLVALRQPPRNSSNLRGWLARVVRRQALQTGRAEARRVRREQEVASPESSLDDIAQRAATQREVVGHVLQLDEVFRTVVLLRFFEGQTPPEIAERLGVPLKTVHSRLARAFEKLRERLDDEYGGQNTWCKALGPLAFGGAWNAAQVTAGGSAAGLAGTVATHVGAQASSGVWIMNGYAKLALTTAFLAGCFGIWKLSAGPDPLESPLEVAAEPALVLATDAAPEPAPVTSELGTRRAVGEATPAGSAATPDLPAGVEQVIRGRVVDAGGQPLVGLNVVVEGTEFGGPVVSGAGGEFALTFSEDQLAELLDQEEPPCLTVEDEQWGTLFRSCLQPTNTELEHLVVVAKTRDLEGWVQDAAGSPIEGANIRMSQPLSQGGLSGFPLPLDMTRMVERTAETNERGRFSMDSFPVVDGLRLVVFASGFVAQRVDLDSASWPLVVELVRPEEAGQQMLQGIVVDSRGQAVAGAKVQLAESRTESGPGGMFRLPIPNLAERTPLCAAKPGFQAALVPAFQSVIDAAGGDPGPVELRLGPPSLSLQGRVVDANGQACPNWKVSIVDGTEISQYRIPIDTAEGLARSSTETFETTDAEGRFELDGLTDRAYTLQAFHEDTLLRGEAVFDAGSTDAVLRVEARLVERLAGVVVALDGSPLAGVGVHLNLATQIGSVGHSAIQGTKVISGEDGTFELNGVPDQYAYLHVTGEGILPMSYKLDPGFEETEQRIEVKRRCHFRLELTGPLAAADRVWFEDAAGAHQQVNRFQSGGMSAFSDVPLTDGRSQVLSVSESAVVLVATQAGEELGRFPIQLVPEGVAELRH